LFDLSEHMGNEPGKLTVGRIVHFYTRNPKEQWNGAEEGPYAAVVTQVQDHGCVNLYVLPNCPLMQPRVYRLVSPEKDARYWWEWPPKTS
jgi:hypothetical protein